MRTILIADDDPAIRAWLTRLLEDAGYAVVAASTVEEAKEALAVGAPDLLITDVRMGDFNGLQLVAMNARQIPAIVMTGHDDPVIRADVRKLGAEFMLKPLASASLLRMIERRLSGAV
jgi:DNA-binding NtrC family response regulator